jgi:tetratricopeptide (TPR) repeat protein
MNYRQNGGLFRGFALFLTVIALGGAMVTSLGAETRIVIAQPTIYPDTSQDRRVLEDAILQAADHITRHVPGVIGEIGWQPNAEAVKSDGSYELSLNAVSDGASRTIALSLVGVSGAAAGKAATGTPLLGPWTGDLYRQIAQSAVYLIAQAEGFPRLNDGGAPRFVDELSMAELIGSTLTTEGASLYPYTVSTTQRGDVVIGAMTVAVTMGPDFRIKELPGRQLLDEGNYSSAMTVATTPAGSVVTRPSMGRELFVYQPGNAEPIRLRNPLTGQGAMTALSDGSVVVVDYANRRAARIVGRQVFPLEIFGQEYSYIPAIAAGPEGNIWTYDTMERRIRIFSPEGDPLDSIVPMLPMEFAAGVRGMTVGNTGDFLLLTTGGLWRFDRSGRAVWSIEALDDEASSPVGQMMSVAWHQPSGSIYIADYMGQRVIRLVEDLQIPMDDTTQEVLRLNAALARTGAGDGQRRGELLAEKARLYYDLGALEMAQSLWQQVLTEDPFSNDAIDQIDAIEALLLRRQVTQLDERVRRLLEEYGRETARRDYSRAIRLYEQILNLQPNDSEMQRAKGSLEGAFDDGGIRQEPDYPLEVAEFTVEPLFPVLLQRYRDGEAGILRLTNPGELNVELAGVSAIVEGFADNPVDVSIPPQIPAGATIEVPLAVALNRDSLTLQEDLPVQVTVEVVYRVSDGREVGEPYRFTRSTTTTLHRRSALIWDDSGKLASFVTPNEEIVAGFALRVLAALDGQEAGDAARRGGEPGDGGSRRVDAASFSNVSGIGAVSPRIVRALRIADALGTYGINYVEDPRSPFSEVHGASQAVDTVRFPRLTLYYRSGDCDDTSALLASMYEAAGLDTAIVTTPGHVLIAFDTKEPVSNRWMFETSGTTVLSVDGTLWIPVETTVVDRGFAVAWQEASQLIRKHTQNNEVEVIPVRTARERYGALPLPEPSFAITEPPIRTISHRIAESSAIVDEIVYSAGRLALEETLAGRAGSRRIPILNRIGILHARFGYSKRAEETFTEIIELRNDYVPGYVNLAQLALTQGDTEAALRYLDQADRLSPDTPGVIDLIARAHYIAGNGREARSAVRRLAEIAPERAERLSIILPPSGQAAESSGRASAAGDPIESLPPGEWMVED